jgi:hypothetical protein
VVGGPGTHPPGWVRCHHAPATPDPFRTAAPKGSYEARIVRELCSRIMRARESTMEYRSLGRRGVKVHPGNAIADFHSPNDWMEARIRDKRS